MEQTYFDFFAPPAKGLAERFGEPPFSVVDTDTNRFRAAANRYIRLGIRSELGRGRTMDICGAMECPQGNTRRVKGVSIFNPRLCELLVRWFCPAGGAILDPFAGGSVRGIVSSMWGFGYTGIDIRREQVEEDERQATELQPYCMGDIEYICGDSREVLDGLDREFDYVFSCPPYADLEVYSDLDGDISNMPYEDFMAAYTDIIRKSCAKLREGRFACFVVGEVRDRRGYYRGFVPDTIRAFESCGMRYYDEIIVVNSAVTACLRSRQFDRSRKVVRVHQQALVFCKGKPSLDGLEVF